MKNRSILEQTSHRPIPMPDGPWVMKQGWNDLLFAHWPVEEHSLLPHIPPGLELERWEGRPWISVAPFLLDPLRLRGMPPVPGTRKFLELNVRTYVNCSGKPGIWFLTLEASNPIAVAGAHMLARLPYRYARMQKSHQEGFIHYVSERDRGHGESPAVWKSRYRAVNPKVYHAEPGTLVHWLTERYCLYSAGSDGELRIGEIHHLPWPLQEAGLWIEENSLTTSFGLVHDPEPALLTYTPRLEVLLWPVLKI
ncbi:MULTISPECIES: YqjF family protein [Paenibacillus]|uniref:DUF2071 domain-containing protein n=1 Tax=Paenibacillus cineris TaxID=237530 RepID=A0ABQ4L759_9BACL|nr:MULTISPECIES: DUF2071 domain-containing protein [Paenibacillus]UYO04284.1 DUF2071 domain-containing protein [Paenibacillus sp. PSB04]GIO52429.1 hypothetical protein J21TS7_07470 [Paenibacillus cineris]